MQPLYDLDIILPCYNPRKNWVQRIASSYNVLQSSFPDKRIRVILVNDGSDSIVKEDLRHLVSSISNSHIISYETNRGKGYALRKGVSESEAPLAIYTDVDFPYEEKSFTVLYQSLLDKETDIATGIRDHSYYNKLPWSRKIISKWLRYLIRYLLRIQITDTQCGLKGFNARGKEIFLSTTIDRYLFDLQFIYLASNTKGITIKPIEVKLKEEIIFSRMNLQVLFHELLNFFSIFFKKGETKK